MRTATCALPSAATATRRRRARASGSEPCRVSHIPNHNQHVTARTTALRGTTRTAVHTGAAKDDTLLELVRALGDMGSKRIQKDWNELVVEPFAVRAVAVDGGASVHGFTLARTAAAAVYRICHLLPRHARARLHATPAVSDAVPHKRVMWDESECLHTFDRYINVKLEMNVAKCC